MRVLWYKRSMVLIITVMIVIYTLVKIAPVCHASQREEEEVTSILYVNSYEEGYKWSDDILEGIQSVIAESDKEIMLSVEYMSTHLILNSDYYELLFQIFEQKYVNIDFDIIITSDDAAFNFLSQYGELLFPDVPRVFCGVNYYDEEKIKDSGFKSGVIEGYDVEATIRVMLDLHPETKNIYYINDESLTGKSIQIEFNEATKAFPKIDFYPFDYELFERDKTVELMPDSLILFLIYTVDSKGNIYDYRYASNQVSEYMSEPIYGEWDFSLGEGIIGGMLTSGYYQGKMVTEQAFEILDGTDLGIKDVLVNQTTEYMFDYEQLTKYGIDPSMLPEGSRIINYNESASKNILVVNSYNAGLRLTDDMNRGIYDGLGLDENQYSITHEYLDTKTYSQATYIYKLQNFLVKKYKDKTFDIIIVTNDNAYEFVKKYYNELFNDIPVVFCGINQSLESLEELNKNFTGVTEKLEFQDTINIALDLFPETKKVLVINDKSTTGQFNKTALMKVLNNVAYTVEFEFWEDLNMSEIQEKGKTLDKETLILLLSYTEDHSNNNFTYDDSIALISSSVTVPIFSIWDFYMDEGIIGGKLMNSYEHGFKAGTIANEIINGKSARTIPIEVGTGNYYMFDGNELEKYGINIKALPKESIVINRPLTIREYYRLYSNIINLTALIIVMVVAVALIIIIILLKRNLRIKEKIADNEQYYANTDILTEIPNRRAGLLKLELILLNYEENKPLTICFIDLNKLKHINDNYGHKEGDTAIKAICDCCTRVLSENQHICRLGGDEFLLILPETTKKAGEEIVKGIRGNLEIYNASSTKTYQLSISVGISEYNSKDHKDINSLIEEADQLMYEDKKD